MGSSKRKDNWRDFRGRQVVCRIGHDGNAIAPYDRADTILGAMPTDLAELCEMIPKADYRQLDKVWVQLAVEMMHEGCSVSQMAALLCAVRDCFREAIDDQAVDAVRMERWKFEKRLEADKARVRENVKHEAQRVVKRQRAVKAGVRAGTT